MTDAPAPAAPIPPPTPTPEAWFVRRFPVGHPRNAMTPAHWKGWAAVGAFTLAMFIGGMGFLLFALTGGFVLGLVLFVIVAAGAGYALLRIVEIKGDKTRVAPELGAPPAQEKTKTPDEAAAKTIG